MFCIKKHIVGYVTVIDTGNVSGGVGVAGGGGVSGSVFDSGFTIGTRQL